MHPEAAELARLVMAMQEERAETYAKLRAAHRTYLASGGGGGGGGYDLETYKVAVDAATKAFQLSSQTAMDLRKKCDKEGGCGDLKKVAGMIERLQVLEERKLKFTVDHQLAQQEVQEHPDDDLQARNAAGLKKELDSITSDIVETIQEIRYLIADEEDDVEDPKR